MDSLNIIIITNRNVKLSALKYKEDSQEEYNNLSAMIELSQEDIKSLGIKEKSKVKLSNEYGAIIAQVISDPECPKGFGFMPVSKLANQLTSYNPEKLRIPNFKRLEVKIEPSI
ncbi:MAG: molybdopterin dinucleotide binding domain-containing protein [Spirochaetota bacterium]|nr:molybdopterin dinucleotide binding domain-containing protein [Spirochaetota bacterium]